MWFCRGFTGVYLIFFAWHLPLFLCLATDNMADSVFSRFMTAVCRLPKLNSSVSVSIYGMANGALEQATGCIYITEGTGFILTRC